MCKLRWMHCKKQQNNKYLGLATFCCNNENLLTDENYFCYFSLFLLQEQQQILIDGKKVIVITKIEIMTINLRNITINITCI